MTDGNVYETLDKYTRENRAAYIHIRNVPGRVPSCRERFIDDGDLNMDEITSILKRNRIVRDKIKTAQPPDSIVPFLKSFKS